MHKNTKKKISCLLALARPVIWDFFQSIFGSNRAKLDRYRGIVECKPGSRVLDFGCATGLAASAYEDCRYLGVDIDCAAINWAQRKYRRHKDINFICADAFELGDKDFDYILCACTGHHIDDELLIKTLEKLLSKLSKTGIIHFVDIIKTPDDSGICKFLMNIDQGQYVRNKKEYENLLSSVNTMKVVTFEARRVLDSVVKPTFLHVACTRA